MSSDPLQTLSPSSLFGSATVPFGTLPGSQPGQLSYGFGLSSASNLNNSAFGAQPGPSVSGWGSLPSWAQSRAGQASGFGSPSQQNQSTSTLPQQLPQSNVNSSPTLSRRRRRSLSEDGDDERRVMSLVDTNSNSPSRQIRNIKKFRSTAQLNPATAQSEAASLSSLTGAREGQDVGKALASLSRDQLLSMFTSLLQTQPALRPTIAALLPAPTLSSTLAALTELERAIISAIPTGAGARAEYIWGRVRAPVEEYLAEARSYLSSYTAAINSASATSTSEDDLSHPSTTFAFLYALASSLRRLEVALPPAPTNATAAGSTAGALSAHLLPLTINAWHVFLTRLSASVNEEGKILSASTVQTWFQRLEELSVPSPAVAGRDEGQARKACEGVRDRLRREVGWLIGLRDVAQVEMEEEL